MPNPLAEPSSLNLASGPSPAAGDPPASASLQRTRHDDPIHHATPHVPAALSTWMTLILATACGLIAANLYYSQPLTGPISAALGLSPQAAGLVVTLTQIGYGAGLLLVVPLGDLLENRRLVLTLLGLETLALIGLTLATRPSPFLAMALLVGTSAVAVQLLVPYAAHLTSEAGRGKAVGNVMSGLMLGIMLARPLASFVADAGSWRAVFVISALLMVLLAVVLRAVLPVRRPAASLGYGAMLLSMAALMRHTTVLRRRALYQACLFGAFSLFWTTTPLWLASPAFGLTQSGIALFALAGVAGAVAAPIAGRLADRGLSQRTTGYAMAAVALAFGLTHLAPVGSRCLGLGLLVAAAIVLDFGVSANVVLGQRAIYSLGAELRSRLNGLFMATFFAGGAIGSALGAWSYARWGWNGASLIGVSLPLMALIYFATENRG